MRVVVTGANRGIGLELCRQLLGRGDTVEAGTRRPAEATSLKGLGSAPLLHVHPLDVADDASVTAFAEELGREDPRPIELLVNNAGVLGTMAPLEQIDLDEARRLYEVNTLGPIRVTRALLPLLRRGTGRGSRAHRKIIHVTSRMGSIGDNTSGGAYPYRMSKAALNMASRSMAIELLGEGLFSAVINPGWVRTDMGGHSAPTSVDDCVRGMLQMIDGLDAATSGAFLDYRGSTDVPW